MNMPAAIVLFVCKTTLLSTPDPNAEFTKAENREWAVEQGQMICRRQVVPLYDTAEDGGAAPLNPNLFDKSTCARIGIPIGVQWDQDHKGSNYRFFRIGCPVPIINLETGKLIGHKMPECPASGPAGPIRCEQDTAI